MMYRTSFLAGGGVPLLVLSALAGCSHDKAGGTDGGAEDSGATACAVPLADRVRITDVPVGMNVVSNEDEAGLRPLVISPIPSGGARLAFMGADGNVHVVTLDEDDRPTGTPISIPANDFSDLHADDEGGVLLLTRDALAGGTNGCGTLTNLCGAANALPADAACSDMYLVRFDGSTETWAVKLTDSSAAHPPYLNGPTDSEDVTFIWWYAHHGRIATDGDRYAAYYGAAISVSQTCGGGSANATGVNIHQGDQMRVVSANGSIVSGGFDWGCSHSGYEHVAWDDVAQTFVAVCKTDNANRIALAPSYSTIRPVDLAYSSFGGIVVHDGTRWLVTSDRREGEPPLANGRAEVHLVRFGNGASLQDVIVASESDRNNRAPHLVAYGAGQLLVAWESSSMTGELLPNDQGRRLFLRVFDALSGASIGASHEVTGVRGNRYHDFRAFPDGSAAFPARGATPASITILRVAPCR